MRCILIDDEPLAINVVMSYCENLGSLEVVGSFTNVLDAIAFLGKEKVDLVFTDIEMPQINGIDFIKSIDQKPLFIYMTAYPEYALEGFELNAVDYLVKPIPFPRFVKAVNRARERFEQTHTIPTDFSQHVTSAGGEAKTAQNFIFVKSDYGSVKIEHKDIKYIQGLKDYLKIYTTTAKPILTLMSFKEIQSKLPESDFVRVHRSYLINLSKIETIQRNRILIEDERIPIGESYKSDFFRRIGI